MYFYTDSINRSLNRIPYIKKALKHLLKGYIKRRDRHDEIAIADWMTSSVLSPDEVKDQRKVASRFKYRPLISVVVPVFNTPRDFFDQMVESVRQQTYDNWELILVDDASTDTRVRGYINNAAGVDARIKKIFLSKNHHISGATNEAINASSGEFVSLFDHDDLLHSNALYEVVNALNHNRDIDFIYTDEVKIDETGARYSDLFLKPDWNPEMLHSINYITHFTTIRRTLLDNKGLLDKNYDGAQDWELFLRLTRNLPEGKIFHIPKTLYSWRVHKASTASSLEAKPYVVKAQKKAIESNLKALGHRNFIVEQDQVYKAQWQVNFKPLEQPLVSIVIVGDKSPQLEKYIETHTAYEKYEIVYTQKELTYKNIKEAAKGEYIVFLVGKVKIHNSNWLEQFLGDAQRDGVGFVVSRYRNDSEVDRNISDLLHPLQASFVNNTSSRALSRHFYMTTKYNVGSFGDSTVMIEVKKLKEAARSNLTINIWELGSSMKTHGYRNLYNPALKMVK